MEHDNKKTTAPFSSENSTAKTKSPGDVGCGNSEDEDVQGYEIEIEDTRDKHMIYGASESPPLYLLLLLAMQQTLLNIDNLLSVSLLVAELICARHDDVIKAQVLSAAMMMTGTATFCMTTFGVRLPIFQGPTAIYLINLLAMSNLPDWKCPEPYLDAGPDQNSTIYLAKLGNGSVVPMSDIIYTQLGKISGSLMIVGVLHFVIGASGLVGLLIRYIGPVTIVPTIVLVGISIYKVIVKFCESSWLVASITAVACLTFSLFLSNRKMPIPLWTPQKGFHIFWYPLHQVFAALFSILIGWTVSAVLTSSGYFSDDHKSKEFLARTDSRTAVIGQMDWFTFPYPGRFGPFGFSIGAFINFFLVTLLSVLDSIADYSTCARVARVTPPPSFAYNRGVAVEGVMNILSGAMGCCHGTVSYGACIGVMGITRVASRRVFQATGIAFIIFACLGKIGAVFITVPYSVLGGVQIVTIGLYVGVVFSCLQLIDLSSTRNLAIIGIALILGLVVPYWVQQNPQAINTGNEIGDQIINMLLGNSCMVGGVFACVMDNTVPGTLSERGLVRPGDALGDSNACVQTSTVYDYGPEFYRLPFIPEWVRRSKWMKFVPLFDTKMKKRAVINYAN